MGCSAAARATARCGSSCEPSPLSESHLLRPEGLAPMDASREAGSVGDGPRFWRTPPSPLPPRRRPCRPRHPGTPPLTCRPARRLPARAAQPGSLAPADRHLVHSVAHRPRAALHRSLLPGHRHTATPTRLGRPSPGCSLSASTSNGTASRLFGFGPSETRRAHRWGAATSGRSRLPRHVGFGPRERDQPCAEMNPQSPRSAPIGTRGWRDGGDLRSLGESRWRLFCPGMEGVSCAG
jgi:hypothetical protein